MLKYTHVKGLKYTWMKGSTQVNNPSFWAALSFPHLTLHIPQPFSQSSCEFLDLVSHKTDQHLLKCVY